MAGVEAPRAVRDEEGVSRLAAFSDAVFAIAMTILVLDLRPPPLPTHPSDRAVWHALALWHDYAGFVISFLVVGSYWAAHHRAFRHVVRWDGALVWLNLLLLLGVTFVPFATAVFEDYEGARPAVLVYAATLAAVGLVWAAFWC